MDFKRIANRVAEGVLSNTSLFQQSEKLDSLASGKDLDNGDTDSRVSLEGEDESYLPFENGFRLALEAKGNPVWFVIPDDDESIGYFFIGSEDEVAARISAFGMKSENLDEEQNEE